MIDANVPVGQRVTPKKQVSKPRSSSSIGRSVGVIAGRAAKQTARKVSSSRSSGGNYSRGTSIGRRSIPENSGRTSRPMGNSGPSGTLGPSYARGVGLTNKPPSLSSYLATDDVYQQLLRSGKKSLADFLSELGRRRGEATTSYNQTSQSMERDRVQQLADLRDEFASRGLIQSGLFGQEQGKFQDQFNQQKRTLDTQQTSLLSDLLSQERNYRREQGTALETARQEALQRRAARYRIGI